MTDDSMGYFQFSNLAEIWRRYLCMPAKGVLHSVVDNSEAWQCQSCNVIFFLPLIRLKITKPLMSALLTTSKSMHRERHTRDQEAVRLVVLFFRLGIGFTVRLSSTSFNGQWNHVEKKSAFLKGHYEVKRRWLLISYEAQCHHLFADV